MRFLFQFALLLLPAAASSFGAPVSFSRQIAPILVEQCLECHRAEKAKGAYRLDTFEHLQKPGDSEEAPLTAGKAEASELYELLVAEDDSDRMPKKADPLPAADIALIKTWISEGAELDTPDAKALLTSIVPEKKRPEPPAKYPRPLPVTAMALNGDGKVLLTSGYYEVVSWDPSTGKMRARIGGMPERTLGLCFVAGGPWLAVAGGTPGRSGEIWVVNYANPTERKRLIQMRDCASCVVASADGKRLYAAGQDNHIRCFSLPDGKVIWDVEAHADWVMALALSHDGRRLATASRDRTARLLNVTDGTIDATFTNHTVAVLSVAFSPDSQDVISGSADGEVLRWNVNGNIRKDMSLRPDGRYEVLSVGFLDKDTSFAASSNGRVNAIDNKARKTKATLTKYEDRANAVLVDGTGDTQQVLTGGHDGEVRVIQVKDAKQVLKFIASPGW